MSKVEELRWVKTPVLDQGFICLVDVMGDDFSVVQAAKTSYGKDIQANADDPCGPDPFSAAAEERLIRYLMRHNHSTPFEMVEFKFLIQAPMDCWRQWIRHRTANVNEYSTRYVEAIDAAQVTPCDGWRSQATDNKQGSGEFLPNEVGFFLSENEKGLQELARTVYETRIAAGVAREQARKDLPLSTYTRAYWKCDLHNIFNFLRLRMDGHAQLEIRSYANAMYNIVKQIVPVCAKAFEDYVLNGCKFSAGEMAIIRDLLSYVDFETWNETNTHALSNRELTEFKKKVGF